jgi:hypothetical protein
MLGGPEKTVSVNAFEQLCDHLETSCKQGLYTFEELYNFMKRMAGHNSESSVYGLKH